MAYTSGSATDWANLADVLHTWLVGTAGWTSLDYTAGTVGTGGLDMRMSAPGNGGGANLFVNIGCSVNATNNNYCWDVRAAIGNTSGAIFGGNPGECSPTYFNLWASTISYWFYANNRRLIVVAKCNTVYMTMYVGMFLPWATSSQYPFPLFVGASTGFPQPYSSTRSSNCGFFDPAGTNNPPSSTDWNGAKVRDPSGAWYPVVHNIDSASSYDRLAANTGGGNYPYLWPYEGRARSEPSGGNYNVGWFDTQGSPNTPASIYTTLVPTAQAERLLLPVYLLNGAIPGGYGALDGCFFPCGGGLTPEQVGSYSSTNYIVFPNVFRVANARSFVAIQEA
jgi:hypothetical protein